MLAPPFGHARRDSADTVRRAALSSEDATIDAVPGSSFGAAMYASSDIDMSSTDADTLPSVVMHDQALLLEHSLRRLHTRPWRAAPRAHAEIERASAD
jgi:hypothetical protein